MYYTKPNPGQKNVEGTALPVGGLYFLGFKKLNQYFS
jgi:hypothetical protein